MKYRAGRYYVDKTNQKLYFCRINCQALEADLPMQIQQLHKEQAVFHLYGTYLALLQEISHMHELSLIEPRLDDIEQALIQKTQVSPEVNQLKILEKTGFIRHMVTAYQQCLYLPSLYKEQLFNQTNTLRDDEIQLVNVSTVSSVWLPTFEVIKRWHQDLQLLIEQFRHNMQEY